MSREVPSELVGLAEIAARLQVEVATVSVWRYRHKRTPRPPWQPFPAPVKITGRSPLFDWATVATWATATGRIPEKAASQPRKKKP
jgi:hypothetical protein